MVGELVDKREQLLLPLGKVGYQQSEEVIACLDAGRRVGIQVS